VLINWDLNKTEKSETKRKGRIPGKKSSAGTNKIFENEFQSALENISTGDSMNIDIILNELNEIENRLIDNPNSSNFFEFQSFIKEVSGKLINKAFKLVHFNDSKKKQYEYVRIIDEKLKELYSQILKKDGNKTKISIIMGNIRGIILDLSA
jgi:uncharacterized protein YaaR (DUF327 family)